MIEYDNAEAEKLLSSLNEPQRKAVVSNDKPLVVFAGAGSGKTRVITTKIAWCIQILGIPSWKILAVTFTNKACNEMKDRIQKMLPSIQPEDLCIKTFHSFGAMVLRRYGERLGLNKNFKIYDEDDSLALLCQIFPNEKRTDLNPIAKRISICKDKMIMPEQTRDGNNNDFYNHYKKYQQVILNTGNVDFADLITRTIELIDKDDEVRQWLHNRFKVVLVDEYQDSNAAQCELLKRVAGPNCFVCVVGDDDQSIYRFRGAEVRNILSFGEYFPGAQIIKLEQNYRSTSNIINLASHVIEQNKSRAPKKIWTDREQGSMPRLIYVDSDYSEASYIAQILLKDGHVDSSAVLYRTNAQSATFESVFNKLRIPYKLVGALRFYDREEVKDVIAHLSMLMNPKDSVSFSRIINKPLRGIGMTSVEKLLEASDNYQGDLIVTCKNVINGTDPLRISGTKGLKDFISAYEKVSSMIGIQDNIDVSKAIIEDFGIGRYYAERDVKEKNIDSKRVKNIEQIVNIISERDDFRNGIEGFNTFIEEASLDPTMMGSDENRNKTGVSLITMHNTKGLEFDRVFISGMEEGIFPSSRSESDEDIEEERRLFYVSITRARNELYLFSCKQRKLWGRTEYQAPSRFLREIPDELIASNKEDKNDSIMGMGSPYGGLGSTPYQARTARNGFKLTNPSAGSYRHEARSSYKPTFKPSGPTTLLSRGYRHSEGSPGNFQTGKASEPSSIDNQMEPEFVEGDIVIKDIYGQGVITAVRAFGARKIYDVKFDDGRRASFVAGKANLKKI